MTAQTLKRGVRLPSIALASAEGARVPVRGHRGPVVVFVPHAPDCAGCLAYVRDLAASADAIAEWGASIRVIADANAAQAKALGAAAGNRIRVLLDPERVLAARVAAGEAAVLVADEWGEIYFTAEAAAAHDLPAADEIVQWARFVAVQCPECEQPEGEWRKI